MKVFDSQIISNYIESKNLSKNKFVNLCKINAKTLNDVLSNKEIPLMTAQKIANSININLLLIIKDKE